MENGYTISTDKNRLDVSVIHDYLSHRSYWGQGRTLAEVGKSIENSVCFGVYDRDDRLVGFARVVTDYVVFAYLMDLFILEGHRNRGLGKRLVAHIVGYAPFQSVRWRLDTKDAHGLYRKYGFDAPASPEKIMERPKAQGPA